MAGGASREGNVDHFVPVDPALLAGLVGHIPVNRMNYLKISLLAVKISRVLLSHRRSSSIPQKLLLPSFSSLPEALHWE